MMDHILSHLRHISSLFGHDKLSEDAAPTTVILDPAQISLFEQQPSSIDLIITSVIQSSICCPCHFHTFLPPCICVRKPSVNPIIEPVMTSLDLSVNLSLSDESDTEEQSQSTAAVAEITFSPCKECNAPTSDVCAVCKLHMHFECGAIRDEEIVPFCEDCCLVLGDVSNIPSRMARRNELIARVAPIYGLSAAHFTSFI
jgi:hypothetical protein